MDLLEKLTGKELAEEIREINKLQEKQIKEKERDRKKVMPIERKRFSFNQLSGLFKLLSLLFKDKTQTFFYDYSAQRYLKEIEKIPPLSLAETVELAQRIEKGDEKAKRRLIISNLKLVVLIAKKYLNISSNLSFLGLIHQGNIGLFKAVEKFDWRKGYEFSIWATWWIRRTISQAIADFADLGIKIPLHTFVTIGKYNQVRRKLHLDLDREPLDEEIAAEMGIEINKIRYFHKICQKFFSLENLVEEDKTILNEFITNEKLSLEDFLEVSKNILEKIEEIFVDLPPRERKILEMRYGLMDGTCHTQEEVGRIFGVTKERIKQIETRLREKLKSNLFS